MGIGLLLAALPLMRMLGLESSSSPSAPSAATIGVAFVGFGLADISFDCLLIPGRALLDDNAVPAGCSDEANALFTAFQLVGRLLALMLGSSAITVSGLGLYDGEDAHFDAVLTLSMLILIGTVILVVTFVKDNERIDVTERSSNDAIAGVETKIRCQNSNETYSLLQQKPQLSTTTKPLETEEEGSSDYSHSESNFSRSIGHWTNRPEILLCAVQAVGWVGICAQSFFWTSWRGEIVGCVDLALQGAEGVVTSALLPYGNRHIGAFNVWCASEFFFHLLMISIVSLGDTAITSSAIPRAIGALSGINYAVHATNCLLVAADFVADPSKRARTIAMVNNTLPMGQLVTALTGGAIAQIFQGFEYVFVCFGFVGAAVTSVVWFISSRRNLFLG